MDLSVPFLTAGRRYSGAIFEVSRLTESSMKVYRRLIRDISADLTLVAIQREDNLLEIEWLHEEIISWRGDRCQVPGTRCQGLRIII